MNVNTVWEWRMQLLKEHIPSATHLYSTIDLQSLVTLLELFLVTIDQCWYRVTKWLVEALVAAFGLRLKPWAINHSIVLQLAALRSQCHCCDNASSTSFGPLGCHRHPNIRGLELNEFKWSRTMLTRFSQFRVHPRVYSTMDCTYFLVPTFFFLEPIEAVAVGDAISPKALPLSRRPIRTRWNVFDHNSSTSFPFLWHREVNYTNKWLLPYLN